MNRGNLCRIANHLWHNVDQENFDMEIYIYAISLFEKGCGCVIGNSNDIWTKREDEKWESYSERLFGLDFMSLEWEWCFSPTWASYDNTPRGAAKRIIYLLLGNNIDTSEEQSETIGVNFDSVLYDHLSIDDLPAE